MRAIWGAAILLLAGCGGMSYAIEHYSGIKPVSFNTAGKTYRVYDKPNENRLMITPSLADAAAAGAIQGATFGLSGNPLGPQGEFRMASQAFLNARSGNCQVLDGSLVVHPQYEFFYAC